jgi:hypothetical protein
VFDLPWLARWANELGFPTYQFGICKLTTHSRSRTVRFALGLNGVGTLFPQWVLTDASFSSLKAFCQDVLEGYEEIKNMLRVLGKLDEFNETHFWLDASYDEKTGWHKGRTVIETIRLLADLGRLLKDPSCFRGYIIASDARSLEEIAAVNAANSAAALKAAYAGLGVKLPE